jgi:hypothetical protein
LKRVSKPKRKRADEQRRSSRILLNLELMVECHAEGGEILFREETYTKIISLFGTLIVLANSVEKDQKLILTNPSGAKQECRVVYLGPICGEKADVGVAFDAPAADFWRTGPAPHYWQIYFPST